MANRPASEVCQEELVEPRKLTDKQKRETIEALYQKSKRLFPEVPAIVPSELATLKNNGRVLVVDETCDSGDTLKLATSAVMKLGPAEVRTAVSFRTGPHEPDYYAMATESFIILPWDREVIVAGELVLRPDYANKLAEPGAEPGSADS